MTLEDKTLQFDAQTEQAKPAAIDQITMIAPRALIPDPRNPRGSMDEEKLNELADSISQVGIQQPLVVRKAQLSSVPDEMYDPHIDEYFHIVFGHRRHAAAIVAGMALVPCIVRELSKREILLIQLTENKHREDVNPFDEAVGISELAAETEYCVEGGIEKLAKDLGVSRSQIYARLKLLACAPDTCEMLKRGYINASHAILLARKSASDQFDAITQMCFEYSWDSNQQKHIRVGDPEPTTWSVRTLEDFLRDTVKSLVEAAWDLNDAKLVEEAGACFDCQFFDSDKGACNFKACFERKQFAYKEREYARALEFHGKPPLKLTTSWLANPKRSLVTIHDYVEVSNRTPGAMPAVIMDGYNGKRLGETIYVVAKPKDNASKESDHGKAIKVHNKYRKDLLDQVVSRTQFPVFQPDDLKALLSKLWNRLELPDKKIYAKILGFPGVEFDGLPTYVSKCSMADLYRIAILFALPSDDLKLAAYMAIRPPSSLETLAKRLGVDVDLYRPSNQESLVVQTSAGEEGEEGED